MGEKLDRFFGKLNRHQCAGGVRILTGDVRFFGEVKKILEGGKNFMQLPESGSESR